MNHQEIEVLTVILFIIVTKGTFLACGGFETIKRPCRQREEQYGT